MSDVDCTPGREPRSIAASLNVFEYWLMVDGVFMAVYSKPVDGCRCCSVVQ